MSLPSNPQQLAALAQGFRRLDKKTLLSIQAKLLAKIAGYGDNPDIDALNRASVQFRNLPATAQVAARTLVIQGNAISGWTLDQGNDPVLGPPYPPVNYQLYIARGTCPPQTTCLAPAQTTSAGTFPAATQPGPNVTRLSWTVPCIIITAAVTAPQPNGRVDVSLGNTYSAFPAKTTMNVYWQRYGDTSYNVAATHTNTSNTDSGVTTAVMADNGDNTSTVTLAGGSYQFTPVDPYPTGAGAVLHWDDGREVIIISITNATTAIVNPSGGSATHAAQQFTMYENTPLVGFELENNTGPGEGALSLVPIYITLTATINGTLRTLSSNVYPVSLFHNTGGAPHI
jgi:hypothetical protein